MIFAIAFIFTMHRLKLKIQELLIGYSSNSTFKAELEVRCFISQSSYFMEQLLRFIAGAVLCYLRKYVNIRQNLLQIGYVYNSFRYVLHGRSPFRV